MRKRGDLVGLLIVIAMLFVAFGLPLFMIAWYLWAVAHGLTPRPLDGGG